MTTVQAEKEIYYRSCLYCIVDKDPCLVKVTPGMNCPELEIKLHSVRVVGCVPYIANAKIASEAICTHNVPTLQQAA